MVSPHTPLNPEQFARRYTKRFRSVYEKAQTVGQGIGNPLGLPSWPNPVNSMVDFNVLACKDGWQAYIEFAAATFAATAWQTFIPNPSELFRKSLLGGYKCGFYFLPRVKTPMNLFIGEGGTQMLAEAVSPFTRVLFWWWVATSVYSGFRAYQTVLHKSEQCENDNCECLLQNGKAPYSGTGIWTQALFMQEISDTCNKYPGAGSAVNVTGSYSAAAAFKPDLTNMGPHTVECAILEDGVPIKTVDYGDSNSKQGAYRILNVRMGHTTGEAHTVSAEIRDVGNHNPLTGVDIDRFTVNSEG